MFESFNDHEIENLIRLILSNVPDNIELALGIINENDDILDMIFDRVIDKVDIDIFMRYLDSEKLANLVINYLTLDNFKKFSDIDFIPIQKNFKQQDKIGNFTKGSYKFVREFNLHDINIAFALFLNIRDNDDMNEVNLDPDMFFNVGDYNSIIATNVSEEHVFGEDDFDYDVLLSSVNYAIEKFNKELVKLKYVLIEEFDFYKN